MTLPISGLTKITGFADPDGRGYRATLRKSQIKGYQIQTWQAPTYGADGFQDGWTAYRFAVMAVAGPMSPAVRVRLRHPGRGRRVRHLRLAEPPHVRAPREWEFQVLPRLKQTDMDQLADLVAGGWDVLHFSWSEQGTHGAVLLRRAVVKG